MVRCPYDGCEHLMNWMEIHRSKDVFSNPDFVKGDFVNDTGWNVLDLKGLNPKIEDRSIKVRLRFCMKHLTAVGRVEVSSGTHAQDVFSYQLMGEVVFGTVVCNISADKEMLISIIPSPSGWEYLKCAVCSVWALKYRCVRPWW